MKVLDTQRRAASCPIVVKQEVESFGGGVLRTV